MRPIREAARERLERIDALSRQVDQARAELGQVEQRIAAIALERRALRDSASARMHAVKASCDRLVYTYCSANVRAREGHATPRCLGDVASLRLPAGFEPVMEAS
jgi:uncharacterized protein (DUF3084 family)